MFIGNYSLIKRNLKIKGLLKINLSKRTMYITINRGTEQRKLAIETFFKFCTHFKNIPLKDLPKDKIFIQWAENTTANNTAYCNRAFQLALEVTYNKRRFTKSELMTQFEDLSFHNVQGQSNTVDQSTIFNAIVGKRLKFEYPLISVQINETPPSNIKPEDLSVQERKELPRNELLTNNKYPDMHIDGEPYDAKISKSISITKFSHSSAAFR
jgi:hypothetical protein